MSNRETPILEAYKEAADALVARHAADIAAYVEAHGARPPFDRLMQETQELNRQLTATAIKAIEAARPQANPQELEHLTASLHQCISKAVTEFINGL